MPEHATWLLTFRTYGSWLPGDARGWVQHGLIGHGAPLGTPAPALERHAAGLMVAPACIFGTSERAVVDAAIRATCDFKRWKLHALAVRTNHVHAVVAIDVAPERSVAVLKAWATRGLRDAGGDGPVWARHGSTRRLPREADVAAAIRYTLEGQDMPRSQDRQAPVEGAVDDS